MGGRQGGMIPNVLQADTSVWFEKKQGILVKVLSVSGWWPMKQLAVRVHFLQCGGFLDDWPVKGILSLVEAMIFAPDESGVKTSWKSAAGTDAGKGIRSAGAQMLLKLFELERLLESDHVCALVSLSVCSRDSRVSF
ncbi:uncharacterized protein TNCV_3437161 [Trichonephila clavipes]|nr:uncharacterized protein TNCV_3437161 [Trichonephila clavipes]